MNKTKCLAQNILNLPMQENDAGADAIRNYLQELLRTFWAEVSGKRPFGNSGWEYELYTALVFYGAVEGEVTEYGVNCYDTRKANQLIFSGY